MGKLQKFNVPGQAHFVTTKTFWNTPIFKDDQCCEILLNDINFYRNKLGFKLLGCVIMPDHLHMIVWWDADEQKGLTISKIMHDIKGLSAQNLSRYLLGSRGVSASTVCQDMSARRGPKAPATHFKRRVIKIWQSSFYDFNIHSPGKLFHKLNYIHQNPVRAGLVSRAVDYIYSSARNYYLDDNSFIEIDYIGL